ncbi:antibiotic biosynthesis monooxygenase family protein [Neptuniibacter halophilus]|uniref:antibiotic biosynthesis monooxygenase family protein n=1 Tax=Neptuniibacter halophilus TaxID=651666 RepID=UPI002572FA93|nr:hypothetical protein [Neptuniibacter halophilus]
MTTQTTTTHVLELITYRAKSGTTEADLIASHDAVNRLVKAQPGFLYRSVSRDSDQLWYDIIYWQDEQSATAGGEAFLASEAGQQLCNLADMESCKMLKMPLIRSMCCDS